MQTTTAAQATSKPLIFARHLIGMGVVALANPLIYYSNDPVLRWLETWLSPLVLSLVTYGLYALFLTKRAKQAWPKSFFILTWVLLAMLVAGPWINKSRSKPSTTQSQTTTPAFNPATARPIELQPASTTQPHSTPSNNGLQPFNGKLDQEVQLVPFTGQLD